MKGLRRYVVLSICFLVISGMLVVFTSCASITGTAVNPAITKITAALETPPSPTESLTSTTILPTISANMTTTPTSTLPPTSLPVITPTSSTSANVTIEIQITNFEVVDSIGSTVGDGYLIYYMIQLPSSEMFLPPPTTTPIIPSPTETATLTPLTTISPTSTPNASPLLPGTQQIPSTELSRVWNDLSSGTYIFSVQLVDTSGMALSPPVVSAVVFMVP